MIKDKNTIKLLLAKPESVSDEENMVNLLNDVSDEFVTDYLKWGFLYKKHDMMNYFFREIFRLIAICGYRNSEYGTNPGSRFKLEILEEKLGLPGLYETESYKEELDKNGKIIHEFFSSMVLSFGANLLAGAYIPFLASANEYNIYNENLVPYNMEELNNLSYDNRDEFNLATIYKVFQDLRDVLISPTMVTKDTPYFGFKHKYDTKTKFKFDQIETFKILNADISGVMFNINQILMGFLQSLAEASPANNGVITNSIYLEKMVLFLSNMVNNMSNYIINLDKEILKNE